MRRKNDTIKDWEKKMKLKNMMKMNLTQKKFVGRTEGLRTVNRLTGSVTD